MNEYILFALVGILTAWVWYLSLRIGDLRSDLRVQLARSDQDNAILSNRIKDVGREFGVLDKRLSDVQCSFLDRFERIEKGLGDKIWVTSEGHARWIALLSTEHLENILAWPGASSRTQSQVADELERRLIDEEYRKAQAPPKAKTKRKTK